MIWAAGVEEGQPRDGRRARAVADFHVLRLSGFAAWATWLIVHLWYLVGFENRLLVLLRWSSSFLTHGRGARLITDTTPRASHRRGGRSVPA